MNCFVSLINTKLFLKIAFQKLFTFSFPFLERCNEFYYIYISIEIYNFKQLDPNIESCHFYDKCAIFWHPNE